MSKKVRIKSKNNLSNSKANDCVVFMTAYKFNTFNKKIFHWIKREKIQNLLSKYHIESFATDNYLYTKKGCLKYIIDFNYYKQSAEFKFETYNKNDSFKNYQDEIDNISWVLSFKHSLNSLLDKTMFKFSIFITMESFLVSINSRLFQVEPIVFFFNSIAFINFELIDYLTGIPLKKDEIYGRDRNYNIIPIDGVQYFNEKQITIINKKKISDVIYDNFIKLLAQFKYEIGSFSYLHNLLVISNSIPDIRSYFLNVISLQNLDFKLKNINENGLYKYYSQDYLGVVTEMLEENKQQALFDCQLLEVLKMYFFINQIVTLDIKEKLSEIINNRIYIDYLLFVPKLPIVTLNALDNIKQMTSFKRYKEAIDFKISYLNLLEEQKKNKNSIILNILIYILTFISGISAWQVLQTELGWSFKMSATILTSAFVIFGLFWIIRECKK